MKETKFYVFFAIYMAIFATLSMFAFNYIVGLAANVNSYTLGVTIVIPLLMLLIFITIMLSTKLAFISSLKKNEKINDVVIKSFKFMLEGIGIIVIAMPIYFITENTLWVLQTKNMNLDLIIGEIIVASLVLIGGICILAQTYISLKSDVEKKNLTKK